VRNRVENIEGDGKPVAGAERGNTRAITPGCVLITSVLAVKEDSAGIDRTVRSASRADVPELTAVLSRAFANEPPFTWVQPDDALRARAQPAMFYGALRYIYPVERGTEVLLDTGAILGGAIWAPPGRWKAPPWQRLRVIPGLIRALSIRHFRQYAQRGKAVEDALHRAHPLDPHWYLAMLGTDPQAQGKGVGSALVRSGLERCDRDGEHAYLECLEPLVPYYEGFGFEITGKIEMPEEVPDQVSMWRAQP
jgi:ribosomal protein S18 acetylase RimI-like enzyme